MSVSIEVVVVAYVVGAFLWFGLIAFRLGLTGARSAEVTPSGAVWNIALWPLALFGTALFELGRWFR